MPSKSDIIAISTLSALLGVTGIALFIWMALTGWEDKTGVVMGVIFIALTALQVFLSAVWYRVDRKFQRRYDVQDGRPSGTAHVELKPKQVDNNGSVFVLDDDVAVRQREQKV